MAVEYGKYKDIDEGTLASDASSLQGSLSPARSELGTLKGTLTDDIWKAGAKATLLTAFDTLDSEVYANLDTDLTTIGTIAGEIGKYKKAEAAALQAAEDKKAQETIRDNAQSSIDNAPEGTDTSSYVTTRDAAKDEIVRLEGVIETEEKNMQDAIDKINELNV